MAEPARQILLTRLRTLAQMQARSTNPLTRQWSDVIEAFADFIETPRQRSVTMSHPARLHPDDIAAIAEAVYERMIQPDDDLAEVPAKDGDLEPATGLPQPAPLQWPGAAWTEANDQGIVTNVQVGTPAQASSKFEHLPPPPSMDQMPDFRPGGD